MLTQSMARAKYICIEKKTGAETKEEEEERKHWALSFPCYTHFTSPIRRYADVMVHRLLTAALNAENDGSSASLIKDMCNRCNDKNSNASKAEMDSKNVHLCVLLSSNPIVVDGIICDFVGSYVVILIPGLGQSIKVKLSDLKGVKAVLAMPMPDTVLQLKWKDGQSDDVIEETFRIFDLIRLSITSLLTTPMELYVQIVHPMERELQIVHNAQAFKNSSSDRLQMVDGGINEKMEEKNIDASSTVVCIDLKSQLAVGISDFNAGVYD